MISDRERKFISHYIENMNSYKACEYAGYQAKTETALRIKASRLLKKKTIQKEIEERLKKVKNLSVIADKEEILRFLTRVLRNQESNTQVLEVNEGKTIINHKYDCSVEEKIKACELISKIICQ